MTLIFTTKDILPKAKNKPIEKLKLKDFFMANYNALGYATSVLYIDDITKQTHNLR